MAVRIVHLLSPIGGGEHSFCGLAFDSFSSGDCPTDDDFIQGPHATINCEECLTAIITIRKEIRGIRFRSARPRPPARNP